MKTERKLMVIGLVCLLVSIAFGSAFAVTRTITSTGDSFDTFIRNSKGNYWTATGANIQVALYDLANTTGAVYVPAGTFYLMTRVKLTNHSALIGAGKGVTIIKAGTGMNLDMITAWDTGTTKPRNNLTIMDLTIDGNSSCSNGLLILKTKTFTIKNVETRNTIANGFEIGEYSGNDCSYGMIIGCSAFNFDTAVSHNYEGFSITNVNNSIMSGLAAYNGGGWGVDFHTCHNNTISDIDVFNCDMGAKFFGDANQQGGNNTVSNINVNKINSNAVGGIWMKREYYSTFSNININNCLYTGLTIDGCNYLTIKGLHVAKCTNIGLRILDDISNPSHITIDGGYVYNYGSFAAVTIEDVDNLTVSHMDFIGAANDQMIQNIKDSEFDYCKFQKGTYGIAISNMVWCKFIGCDFSYNSIDGVESGISSANNNVTWDGCFFKRNAKGMDLEADNNMTIVNSRFAFNSNDAIESNLVDSIILMGNTFGVGQNFDDNSVRRHNINGTTLNLGYVKI